MARARGFFGGAVSVVRSAVSSDGLSDAGRFFAAATTTKESAG